MPEIEIHNGEILVDGEPSPELASPEPKPRPGREPELSPDEIASLMAWAISEAQAARATPMEIVNRLLGLKTPGGQKVVWTKWDVRQLFALWAKKMEGSSKL